MEPRTHSVRHEHIDKVVRSGGRHGGAQRLACAVLTVPAPQPRAGKAEYRGACNEHPGGRRKVLELFHYDLPALKAVRSAARSASISVLCTGRAKSFASVSGTGTCRPMRGPTISRNLAGCAVATMTHRPDCCRSRGNLEYASAAVAVCGHHICPKV